MKMIKCVSKEVCIDESEKHKKVKLYMKKTSTKAVESLTQIFWCPTRLCDRSILKLGQVEIPQNYFVVVVFCVIHQVFQLNK